MEPINPPLLEVYLKYKESCKIDQIEHLIYDEFVIKLLKDKEFAENYNVLIEETELTYDERYNFWFVRNFETGMEYNEEVVPDFDNEYYEPTPTKQIKLTYKNITHEFYE